MKASRWITLGGAAIGAALVVPQLWTPAATAPAAVPRPAEQVRAEPATDFARLLRRDFLAEPAGRAPFASTSPQPRATSRKPVAAPLVEAPATVPQFPYRWAGRVELGRTLHQAYFMRSNGELVSVLPGQVIDGVWRIDRLTSEQVEVTYVPLAASFPLALAQLSAERDGAASSAQGASQMASSSQIGPGSGERSAVERRPLAPEPSLAAGGAARGNAPALIGGPAVAPAAAAGRASGVPAAAVSGAPAAVSAGRLGSEVPTSGSMPGPNNAERGGLTVADANARGIAGGAIPQGRLGEVTPSGKLGVE